MRRHHTHTCQRCKTGKVDCGGARVDNYDGWPPVLCSVEAAMLPGDEFVCEDCEHEQQEGRDDDDTETDAVAADPVHPHGRA